MVNIQYQIGKFMSKDKVVDLVKKADVKKALCTITLHGGVDHIVEYEGVAGYQLIEGVLAILIHEGPTHLVPVISFNQATITANKE
jgi:hypothetical protein